MIFRIMKKVNEVKNNEIIMTNKMHTTKIYNRNYRIKQCFNCYKYEHLFTRCTNKINCEKCVHNHETSMKNKSQSKCLKSHLNKCVNCYVLQLVVFN